MSEHKNDMVLVCYENGSVRFNTCWHGEWTQGNPIAWMPLPEPYKEKDNEKRSFDEMIAYFNRRVAEMDIAQDYKMELLGMVTALGYKHEKTAQPKQQWTLCDKMPDKPDVYLTLRFGYGVEQYEALRYSPGVGFCRYSEEDGEYYYVPVHAWMPIEPWRGEEQ